MRRSLKIAQRLRGSFSRLFRRIEQLCCQSRREHSLRPLLRAGARGAAAILALLVCFGPVEAGEDGTGLSLARQKELIRLVRQDCGSCHGMTLAGGLGPALLPAALGGKPAEGLVATVLYGRPGTPMPPWGVFLNEDEVKWVVEMLLKGFPNEP